MPAKILGHYKSGGIVRGKPLGDDTHFYSFLNASSWASPPFCITRLYQLCYMQQGLPFAEELQALALAPRSLAPTFYVQDFARLFWSTWVQPLEQELATVSVNGARGAHAAPALLRNADTRPPGLQTSLSHNKKQSFPLFCSLKSQRLTKYLIWKSYK